MFRVETSSSDRNVLVMGNTKQHSDGEIIIKAMSESTTNNQIRAHLRTDGVSGDETGYFAELYSGDTFRIVKYTPGTTVIQSFSYNWSANVWYWIRFQAIGQELKAKVWRYDEEEPEIWMIETTDSDYSEGYAGIGYFTATGNKFFEVIELQTGGIEYSQAGNYTTLAIDFSNIPDIPRICWETDKPVGTSVIVEVAFTEGNTPNQDEWTEQQNGALINTPQGDW